MKKLAILLIFSLFGCLEVPQDSKKGTFTEEPQDFIKIHNKVYKLMKVRPCDNCNSIWIMYPKDSLDEVPQSINYQSGKTTTAIIKVE